MGLFCGLILSHAVSETSAVLMLGRPIAHPRRRAQAEFGESRHGGSGDGADLLLTVLMDLNGSVQDETTPFICILLSSGVWQPLNVVTEN